MILMFIKAKKKIYVYKLGNATSRNYFITS